MAPQLTWFLGVCLVVAALGSAIAWAIKRDMRRLSTPGLPKERREELSAAARAKDALRRLVPSDALKACDYDAFEDLGAFARAAIALCGTEAHGWVVSATADPRETSVELRATGRVYRAVVPADFGQDRVRVDADSAGTVLGLINRALADASSPRRIALVFDRFEEWLCVADRPLARQLKRNGVKNTRLLLE